MSKQSFLTKVNQQWRFWSWVVLLTLGGCGEPPSDKPETEFSDLKKSSTELPQTSTPSPNALSKTTNKIDEKKQHILLIGDSMAGAAGLEYGFRKYAAHNKHRLTVVSQASSNTENWSKNKQLKTAIAIHKPTYVIITLGANELFVKDLEQRKIYIKDIIKQAGDTPIIWAGPPNWREDTGINDAIRSIVGKARFFNSTNVDIARQKDGIHPNLAGSIAWSRALGKWIMTESRHKIRLNSPFEVRVDKKN